MDKKDIPYEISPMLLEIVKKAQEDAHITPEEAELISRIQVDIEALEAEITEAYHQGDEDAPINIYKEKKSWVLENARKIALKDGRISEDEQAILDKLFEKLEEYQIDI